MGMQVLYKRDVMVLGQKYKNNHQQATNRQSNKKISKYILLMIGADSPPFLFVLDLQSAEVNTEVINESYIRWPDGSCAVWHPCFSERYTIVRLTLAQNHSHALIILLNKKLIYCPENKVSASCFPLMNDDTITNLLHKLGQ